MTYEEWMIEVDKLFLAEFGLTHSDFEDSLWMDAYISGDTPKSAFENFCEEMGYRAAKKVRENSCPCCGKPL